MFEHKIDLRVRYSETDKMGFVYYGNYAAYYELGRVEALRTLGLSYRDLEDDFKIFMPVMSLSVKYLRPGKYDDLLRIHTKIPYLPKDDILFVSEIFNESGKCINRAEVLLCFLSAETKKRIDAPDMIVSPLKSYFE